MTRRFVLLGALTAWGAGCVEEPTAATLDDAAVHLIQANLASCEPYEHSGPGPCGWWTYSDCCDPCVHGSSNCNAGSSGGNDTNGTVVTLFEDCGFSGASVTFGLGNYTMSDMAARGAPNDWMSSLFVEPGYEVELFEHHDFTGHSVVYAGDDSCLVAAGYNDWVSSIRVRASAAPSPGSGGDFGIRAYLSESQFNQFFPNRLPVYTYANLVQAADMVGFATSGDATKDKRNLAALLSLFAHEAGHLQYVREIRCNHIDGPDYPNHWPCNTYEGGAWFYGRGPKQLTHYSNYLAFGNWLGVGSAIADDADRVATDGTIAFQSAFWYYMTQPGPGGWGAHCNEAMDNADGAGGYGHCINHVNGALECNGGNPGQVNSRVDLYKAFCDALGVSYGNNLYC